MKARAREIIDRMYALEARQANLAAEFGVTTMQDWNEEIEPVKSFLAKREELNNEHYNLSRELLGYASSLPVGSDELKEIDKALRYL